MSKQGNIRISSENMMPIIKKWLYSDKDIFLREIVSNGIDAITKYKKLSDMGEAPAFDGEFCIKISVDKDAKTLTVEDNGLGMTEEEVSKALEPFYTKSINGTGLGLSIVSRLVESNGGTMEIVSKPGVGTDVVLRFPGKMV